MYEAEFKYKDDFDDHTPGGIIKTIHNDFEMAVEEMIECLL